MEFASSSFPRRARARFLLCVDGSPGPDLPSMTAMGTAVGSNQIPPKSPDSPLAPVPRLTYRGGMDPDYIAFGELLELPTSNPALDPEIEQLMREGAALAEALGDYRRRHRQWRPPPSGRRSRYERAVSTSGHFPTGPFVRLVTGGERPLLE